MIAVSDAVLILVSAAALGSGLYRWQNNLDPSTFANARPPAQVQVTSPQRVQNTNAVVAAPAPVVTPTPASAPAAVVAVPQPTVTNIAVSDNNSANVAATNAAPAYGTHTVQSGEILGRIALRYDTTVETLQTINNLDGTLIDVGQKLNYPLPGN